VNCFRPLPNSTILTLFPFLLKIYKKASTKIKTNFKRIKLNAAVNETGKVDNIKYENIENLTLKKCLKSGELETIQ